MTVRTSPWCDLVVDERPAGRTPQTLELPAGRHRLHCLNPSGARLERELDLAPGAVRVVEERLITNATLVPRLVRGDAIQVGSDTASAAARTVAPGRNKLTLLRGGQVLEAHWIDVPPGGCTLVDTPELRCEAP